MSLRLVRRQKRAFDRLYRRYAAGVYRYALLVLGDPAEAEAATHATFLAAYGAYRRGERPREPRAWLIAVAHDVCARRSAATEAHPLDGLHDVDAPSSLHRSPTCSQAERAISRELDGHLRRSQRALLRTHLRSCTGCADIARSLRRNRAALRSFSAEPVPESLAPGPPRRVRVASVAGAAVLTATAVVLAGVVMGALARVP